MKIYDDKYHHIPILIGDESIPENYIHFSLTFTVEKNHLRLLEHITK